MTEGRERQKVVHLIQKLVLVEILHTVGYMADWLIRDAGGLLRLSDLPL
jgi:hypothetical protein